MNNYLKNGNINIKIDVNQKDVLKTNLEFWSHDLKSGLLTIKYTNLSEPVPLVCDSSVRLIMRFTEKGETKHRIETMTVADKVNGIATLEIPDEILGYEGIVECGTYIDFKNGQTLDAGYFTFRMRKSMIDGEFKELDELYVKEFSEALKKFEEIEKKIQDNDLVTHPEFSRFIEDNNKNIDEKNNKKADLKLVNEEVKRLDELKSDKKKTNEELDYLSTFKADASYVKKQFEQIGNGTPVDTVNNEIELYTKYPQGVKGTVVVLESDGKTGYVYRWDTTTNKWMKGALYQGLVVADNSISTIKRTTLGEFGTLSLSGVPNINTTTKQLEIGNYYAIPIYRNKRVGDNLKNTNIIIGEDRPGNFLAIDLESESIVIRRGIENFNENEIFLGYCFWDTKQFSFPFSFTVDNEAITPPKSISTKHVFPSLLQGSLLTTAKIKINNNTKSIDFSAAGVVLFLYGTHQINLSKYLNTSIDLSARNGNYMVFDVILNEIISLKSVAEITNNQVYFGYINFGNNFAVELKANYTLLDTNIVSPVVEKKWLNKKFSALGDSITFGDNGVGSGGNAVSWVVHVAKMLGVQAVNVGKNGSTFIKRSSRTDSFVERCVTIKDADVITVWGGINDFHSGAPIDVFKESVDLVLLTLIKNNPNAKILLLTPMKATKFVPSFSENTQGLTQLAYVDILKTVADYYSVPVLDMYTNANITPFVDEVADVYMKDRLHPTNAGYIRLTPQIASALESL